MILILKTKEREKVLKSSLTLAIIVKEADIYTDYAIQCTIFPSF